MSAARAYERAVRRVFGEVYPDKCMAIYWGRDDGTIHVIASVAHYVHKIASENENTLEFISSVGDRIIVELTEEERRQLVFR